MPATITYVHDPTERLTHDYMIKEIIAVLRTLIMMRSSVISRLLFHLTTLKCHIVESKFVRGILWVIDRNFLLCRRTESGKEET
ncbi:unnamed protein product [Rhizophagus irregularis]|nr:unnamed protein product [Rhizophagus irregularis]